MTVGIVLAQRRLRSSEIFCVNPSVINVCGVINVACFDKTGTLTEDGLDMWGIIPYEDGLFGDPELDPSQIEIGPLMECLATCHSLTLIEGVLSGDPVDLKMFQSTKWEFIEEASDHCKFEMAVPAIVRPSSANSVKNNVAKEVENDDIPYEVGILRQFPFSSSLQRMSVIARALNRNHFSIYTKGAPETIEQLCRCDTIPSDFHSTLLEYTREGYRVLALAWKPLKANYAKVLRVPRERVEQDLLFLGLLIMENRLKPETTQVIQTLRYANIRPVMVTGDNMLTALSVARDCEMIDELDRIILVSAKPPPSSFHQSSDIHVVANNPTDASIQSSNNITSNQQNIYCVNPTALSAHMIQPEKSKPHGRSSFNATASSLYQEKFFEQQLQQQQQDDSLVEFHYAEDLHRPVTEVTATTETSPTRNYKSQRATTSSSSTTEKDISHSSLREFKKSRKWMRRICKGAPCLPSDSASHSTPASSPLTDVTQVPNVSLSDQSRLDSSAEQKHQHKNHQYQPINGMSCLRGRHQSTPVKTPHPVSIRMLDRPDFHLAMSGKTWAIIREHYPWLIPKLVVKGTVFARFLPEQKAQLIEALQSVGYFVSMCGDGANDCGALKVAHAGIALSEAEASVASPFTSKQQNISCVLTLIREGRCALTTSFGAFKFMVGYSMIQFFSAILLYYIGSNISDFQFLYIDFFLITTLGLTFGYTPAYPRLSVEPPGMRLLSTVTLLSLGLQLFTCALIQFAVFTLIRMQPWYLPLNTYHEDYELLNYESTAVFTVSVYQYIILAIVFSKGAPYRRSIFSNYIFLCNVAVCVGASLYLTTHPTYIIRHLFELCRIPSVIFILILHGIALGNLLFGCILESIVDGVSFRQRIRHIRLALFPRHVARKDYERIRDEIDRLAGVWPPIIRSASVQALPRELFNEANVNAEVASQLNYSRKRYNSGLSTDSEDNDNDADDINNGDNVSISCHMKAQLYNPVNDTATTPTHFLPTSDNPPKSVIENNPTRKKRTRSTSSHRRHSFHTGDLDRKEAKRSTSREDAPKQHASIVSKISDDEHVRSHSGRRHDAHYNKQHIVDAQPQLNAFHSSTNC
uniref:Cation-transporting ATPase n=1 Tax=Trichobilharzia regenti TaxID=157069 RepID=A0AA85K8V5_TRIRE|nr:unnamed protein product [Trichobilharzia regenti]